MSWAFQPLLPAGGQVIALEVNNGRLKVWSGTEWVIKPAKVWTGAAWVEKPVKFWNGVDWVLTTPTI